MNKPVQTLSFLSAFLLCCLFFRVNAQSDIPRTEHFSTENGLSHNVVNRIFRDSRGLVWIATYKGLNRYDGKNLKTYYRKDSRLSLTNIQVIIEDEEGMLWLKNDQEEVAVFNPYAEQAFSPEEYLEGLLEWPEKTRIFEDGEGSLFLLTPDQQLFRYFSRRRIEKIGHLKLRLHDVLYVRALHRNAYGIIDQLIAGEQQHAWLIVDGNGELQDSVYAPNFEYFNIVDGQLLGSRVMNAQQHVHYRFTGSGYAAYVLPPKVQAQRDATAGSYVNLLPGHFQLGKGSACSILDQQGKTIFAIDIPEKGKTNAIFFDGKQFWLNNFQNGIYLIRLHPANFKTLLQADWKSGQAKLATRGIVSDSFHRLWIYPNFILDENGRPSTKGPDLQQLGYRTSLAFLKDSMEAIWTVLKRKEETGNEPQSYLAKIPPPYADFQLTAIPQRLFSETWSLYQDSRGSIWIGDAASLIRYDPSTKQIRVFDQYNDFKVLEHAAKYGMLEVDQQLWIYSDAGLFVLDSVDGVVARYAEDALPAYILPAGRIHHIYRENQDVFWLGTGDNGLIRWDRRAHAFQVFNTAFGLPSDIVHAIYEDDYHCLWLNTEEGIVRFHKQTHFFQTWLPRHGIADPEGNRISHYRDEHGNIYFGSINGVSVFHPKDFQDERDSLALSLELLSVRQISEKTGQLEDRLEKFRQEGKITVQPAENYLEFALVNPDLSTPASVFISYRISAWRNEWLPFSGEKLRISNLPPGHHQVEWRMQNLWGDVLEAYSVPLEVLPPLYLRWWFLGLLATLIGVIIYAAVYTRTYVLEQQRENLRRKIIARTATIEQQAEELRHLDQAKSRFFANVSHELRTPLTLLLGSIGTVLDEDSLDHASRRLLNIAQQSGRDLFDRIDELLDLSRLESGKLSLHEQSVDLRALLQKVSLSFSSYAKRSGIHFEFFFEATENLSLQLDADKLETVIRNLLSNAFKFTPAGGKVSLRLEAYHRRVLLSVTDTGRGISPADLPHIFDRFFTGRQVDTPTEGGTGIGLSLCRELLQLMQGKIWATSVLGQGSIFYVELPKKSAGEIQKPIFSQSGEEEMAITESILPGKCSSPVEDLQKPLILVVEDHPGLRDYLEFIMGKEYRVVTAGNGRQALHYLKENQSCKENRIDLIISDIMMPEMDGFQLLQQLKSQDKWRHLPTIILTARTDLQDKLRALRIGVDDYLVKPFEQEELLAVSRRLLANARIRLQGAENNIREKPVSRPVVMTEADALFLQQLEQLILDNMGEFGFTVSDIAHQLFMGQTQLYKKIRKLTGITPNQYIQEVRFSEARKLLEEGKYQTVKEVVYAVGLKDTRYFSNQFKERFGKLPSDYLTV